MSAPSSVELPNKNNTKKFSLSCPWKVTLSCKTPASAGMSLEGCRAQGHNKRDTVFYGSLRQNDTLTMKVERKIPAYFKLSSLHKDILERESTVSCNLQLSARHLSGDIDVRQVYSHIMTTGHLDRGLHRGSQPPWTPPPLLPWMFLNIRVGRLLTTLTELPRNHKRKYI
jgi:hypothetical protein